MYNALLESWRGTYAWWREHNPRDDRKFPEELNHSRYDLFKMFTRLRAEDPRWAGLDTRAFPEDRGREGLSPGAARNTNNHRKTGPPRVGPRVVVAEQYAGASGRSGI